MISRNTQIRVGVLSLGALALLFLLVLDMRRIASENLETARLLTEYAETEKAESAVHTIRALQTSASEEIEAFDSLTLTNDRLVPLIESIEEAGRALKLALKISSVEKKDEGEGSPQLIRIAIEASGDWNSAFTLLRAIESLPYRVMIENTSLTKEENIWRENITLSLHSFK